LRPIHMTNVGMHYRKTKCLVQGAVRRLLGAAVPLLIGHVAIAQPAADDATRQQKMDLQERCSRQAEHVFKQSGWREDLGSGYQSHYNMALGRCLIEMDGRDANEKFVTTTKSVTDAFENRVFALYVWMSQPPKKYWEVPPFQCELTPSANEKRTCTTEQEVDDFAAGLMEQ
jgi:hypothetical protein